MSDVCVSVHPRALTPLVYRCGVQHRHPLEIPVRARHVSQAAVLEAILRQILSLEGPHPQKRFVCSGVRA